MKLREIRPGTVLLAAILGLAVSGCLFKSNVPSMSDQSAARRKMKEQPAKVVHKGAKPAAPAVESTAAAKGAPAASNEDPTKRLEENLRKRQTALEMERARTKDAATIESTGDKSAQAERAAGGRTRPEAPVAPPVAAVPAAKDTATAKEAAVDQTQEDLTVAGLRDRLSKKDNRSPDEEEAYRRLLGGGQVEAGPDDKSAAEWALLSEARDAVARNDFAAAREKAKQALALIRQKTDPVIDRLCFATRVRSYGDADLVEPAAFGAGQKVLAVTDVSDFACLPAGNSSPPKLYYAKISQRLAIYDGAGKIQWQNDYGTFEYQSSHPISAMFIPSKFELPRDMKSGEYTLTVEIADVLAGRRTQAKTAFTVK